MTKDNDFKNYQIDKYISKAFHFSPDGCWCQSFIIVWTPGYINVLGDMGNLIIEHYSMDTFKNAVKWLQNALKSPNYFMEKVRNFKKNIFDAEKTKKILIEHLSNYDKDYVKQYACEYLSFDFINEKLFDYQLNRNFTNIEDGHDITGAEIAEKLKDYDLTEEDIQYINDFELPVYTYDWEFLTPRLDALKEFAEKIQNESSAE